MPVVNVIYSFEVLLESEYLNENALFVKTFNYQRYVLL